MWWGQTVVLHQKALKFNLKIWENVIKWSNCDWRFAIKGVWISKGCFIKVAISIIFVPESIIARKHNQQHFSIESNSWNIK